MAIRILIIEDNGPNLELMGYLLQAFGYTPIKVESGAEGLEAARRELPDLILCDIHLPGMDGLAVARELKRDAALRDVPLLAVTALAMVGDREKVMASGFDGYLAKPIVPETFVAQIEAFLASGRKKPTPAIIHEEVALPPRPSLPAEVKAKVLAIDDLPANIDVLSTVLVPSGYSVLAAQDIAEGIRLAKQHIPDIIICDIHLYNESGYDFFRLVKADAQLRSIPFVFASATLWRAHEQAAARALGVDDLILRPIDPPKLLAVIEAVLRKHRNGDEPGCPGGASQ